MTTTIQIHTDSAEPVEGLTVTVQIKGAPRKAQRRDVIDTTGYSLDERIGDVIDLATRRVA